MARCTKTGCHTDHQASSGVLAAHNREARTSTGKSAGGDTAARYGNTIQADEETEMRDEMAYAPAPVPESTLSETERNLITSQVLAAASAAETNPAMVTADSRANRIMKIVDGRTAVDSLPALHRHLTALVEARDNGQRLLRSLRTEFDKGVLSPGVLGAAGSLDEADRTFERARAEFVGSATTEDAKNYYGAVADALTVLPAAQTAAEKYPQAEPGATSASKDPDAARNRSYDVRIKQPQWMTLREPALISRQTVEDGPYERLMLPTGTRVWADREINAGFRGIETSIRLTPDRDDPDRAWWQTVSTGILDNK